MAPLLLNAGAAALGWWRVRQTSLAVSPAARQLQGFYQSHALQALLFGRGVARVSEHLRSAGVEPLLAKGWAIARLYPEPGLHPYGDIDLLVRPEQYARAQEALRSDELPYGLVDLHAGFSRSGMAFSLMDDRGLDALYERSQLVPLGDTEVRILGPEDHLRLLCLHFLGHGAFRALWLCDVAVALETRPAAFDWERCLGGSRRRADWVVCALGLAHQLLGARLDDTPVADRASRLPRWLVPTVLQEWGRGSTARVPLESYRRRPIRMLKELTHCWPNGIAATVDVRGPFNEWPRFGFQLASCLARAKRLLVRLA